MSDQPAKKPRLAAAAEALIEAASLEADAVTQKQLVANLHSLKSSFDNNLNKVVQSMKSSNENFDAKINTLNQHVASVKSEISALKTLMEEERKQKVLEAAKTMTHLNSFQYHEINGYNTKKSSDLAKAVIEWFSLGIDGYGYKLPSGLLDQIRHYDDEGQKNAKRKAFRDKFVKQIKDLIKREPRLAENNGIYTIYYN